MQRSIFTLMIVGTFFAVGTACSVKEPREDDLIEKVERAKYQPEIPEQGQSPLNMKIAFFAFDSAELSPAAKEVLHAQARWLKANPEASVQIEGYCDVRGTNEYNLQLGEHRALATKAFLLKQGISPHRVSTFGFGRVPDPDRNHWQGNRRTGFVVFYPSMNSASGKTDRNETTP